MSDHRSLPSTVRPPLTARARPPRVPLSDAQRRLWLVHQRPGAGAAYHMPEALRLRGPIDAELIRRTMELLIARHEILRTRFVEIDGEPTQVIDPRQPVALPIEVVSDADEASRLETVERVLRGEWERPFDLARGPLLRLRLLQLGAGDHVFIRTCHHIIFDGWSRSILTREFQIVYEALREGRSPELPPLPIQYADFALWQQDGASDADLAYWTAQLAGLSEATELPADRARRSVGSATAHRCAAEIPAPLADALRHLSRQQGVTLYMTLLAGFAALVARYTGQEETIVGSPMADRPDVALAGAIGPFLNLLPMRLRVTPGMRVRALLNHVRWTTLEAYEHRDVSFDRIVERVAPARQGSGAPLVNLVFNVLSAPRVDLCLPGVEVERLLAETRALACDLEVYVSNRDAALDLSWVYDGALFDRWRIEQMARHYVRLLEAMAADPDLAIDEIDLLSHADRVRIVTAWHRTLAAHRAEDVRPVLIPWLRGAPSAPAHHVAIDAGDSTLTYGDLDRECRAVARHLQGAGAARSDLVGILIQDRMRFAVAAIGALVAGCGFVPLDPTVGEERVDGMVADCQLQFVVTDEDGRAYCERWSRTSRILAPFAHASADGGDTDRLAHDLPRPEWHTPDPCYVYFTSGSTGRPKGIAGRLAALDHFIGWEIEALGLTPGVRVSQLIGVGHDPYLRDLFVPLCAGGTLCIPPDRDIVKDGARLVAWLDRQRVEVIHCVPSILRLMLQEPDAGGRLSSLRFVLACGEPLLPADVARWFAVMPAGARLINLYGPTETTLAKLAHVVGPDDRDRRSVPIGRPIRGAAAIVLDDRARPCPPGITGEIYIATPHRTHGYYRRPDLTSQVFVPDPLAARDATAGDDGGEPIYRTGDLGRQLANGDLEFVGRRDGQVKIRGCRVELGEIEAVLLEQDGVRAAAAAVRDDARGEPGLVAYFAGPADPQQLRRILQRRLPAVMVPHALVRLDAIPLTTNGKVDRRALPAPRPAAPPASRAPRSPREAALCTMFAEVLGVDRVGIDDDFFELGGHSLTAVRLANRVRAAFAVEISLAHLLEAPCVAELATRLNDS